MVEFEADDAIATAAARFAAAVEQVVIVSPDKDFAQCVDGQRVVIHDRIRRITYDEAGVLAKFGVPPTAIPDYLALVGDAADGIPGLPGWGAKSAAAVLSAYGRLEAIPDDPRRLVRVAPYADATGSPHLADRRADAATLTRPSQHFVAMSRCRTPRGPGLAWRTTRSLRRRSAPASDWSISPTPDRLAGRGASPSKSSSRIHVILHP